MRAIKQIRSKYNKAAFLIGNGPNLNAGIMPSWKELIVAAGDHYIDFNTIAGLTNTEVYDLVELRVAGQFDVKKRVVETLRIQPSDDLSVHERLMKYAKLTNSPVLTTNFDAAFETSIGAKRHYTSTERFTRFYPWKTYYGAEQHRLGTEGFGIWKIHGDIRYPNSIRLGLTDYMGSVERARRLIHNGDDRLFRGKRQRRWQGYQTWLHIWFNMPLIIVGFGYGTDEVFLRWLLIERKRYLNFSRRDMDVWLIDKGEPDPAIKNLFENLGVRFKVVSDYSEIYG